MTTRRSPVPSSVTDPAQQAFLDQLYKRLSQAEGDAATNLAALNADIDAAEARLDAIESRLDAVDARLDDLENRQVAAVATLAASPTVEQISTAFNTLIAAMQASEAMET